MKENKTEKENRKRRRKNFCEWVEGFFSGEKKNREEKGGKYFEREKIVF